MIWPTNSGFVRHWKVVATVWQVARLWSDKWVTVSILCYLVRDYIMLEKKTAAFEGKFVNYKTLLAFLRFLVLWIIKYILAVYTIHFGLSCAYRFIVDVVFDYLLVSYAFKLPDFYSGKSVFSFIMFFSLMFSRCSNWKHNILTPSWNFMT